MGSRIIVIQDKITNIRLCVCVSQQSQVKESSQALPVQMDVPVEEGEGELPVRYERDLVQKLKVLRHELSLQQPQAGHCRIEVSREEIFEVEQAFFAHNYTSVPYKKEPISGPFSKNTVVWIDDL